MCSDVLTVKRPVDAASETTVDETEEEPVVREYNQMAINIS